MKVLRQFFGVVVPLVAAIVLTATALMVFIVLAAPGPAWGAHTEEPAVYPDVLVTFGCLDEQVTLNLQEVWEAKGNYWFSEVASQYMQTGECFFLTDPGYPAYVDRVVKKAGKKFDGEDAYAVEAHFLGAAEGKTFFFLYYGELPARARRSAA